MPKQVQNNEYIYISYGATPHPMTLKLTQAEAEELFLELLQIFLPFEIRKT